MRSQAEASTAEILSGCPVSGRRAGQADLWQEVKEFLENALEAFGSGRPGRP